MQRVTRADAAAAAKRLVANDDYKLIYSFVAAEFDVDMRHTLTDPADNELFVTVGRARAFDYVLQIMRGETPSGKPT